LQLKPEEKEQREERLKQRLQTGLELLRVPKGIP